MATNNPPVKSSGGHVDLFIKMTGQRQGVIKGESFDGKHLGEIDVHSYTWSVIQPVSTEAGMSTGKRQLGQFKFLMRSQSATPRILSACCTGEHLKDVTLTCRKAGGKQMEYMIWKLTNAFVAGVKTGYLVSDDITPYDEVSLVFQKVELEYKPQGADGSLGAGIVFMDDWQVRV
jgi:type VI secretion system secreted protein Hcp